MMNTCLVFETGKPSHEVWVNFVGLFPELNLSQIVTWLELVYAAKFRVDTESWSLEFPDALTCTQFVVTWL